jgi:hypothetical protein
VEVVAFKSRMEGIFMQIGDLTYDVVTESLWIIMKKWVCPFTSDTLYDVAKVDEPSVVVVINEDVIAYMRADFLKRTNSVLDKSAEKVIINSNNRGKHE